VQMGLGEKSMLTMSMYMHLISYDTTNLCHLLDLTNSCWAVIAVLSISSLCRSV
jgi:hypothetical protein